MQAVSRADNLAQFMQLVSAARARTNETQNVSNARKPAKMFAAHGILHNAKTTANQAAPAVQGLNITAGISAGQTRNLGTKFDAYA